MASKGETKVVNNIRAFLTKEYPGCFHYKVNGNGFQKKGLPDIIGCINGRFIGLEVKDPANTKYGATELQLHRIEEIKKAGGIAGVVTTIEEVKELLDSEIVQAPERSSGKAKRKKEVCPTNGTGDREDLSGNKKNRKVSKTKES